MYIHAIYVVYLFNILSCKGFNYKELSTHIACMPFTQYIFLACLLERSLAMNNKVQTLQSCYLAALDYL